METEEELPFPAAAAGAAEANMTAATFIKFYHGCEDADNTGTDVCGHNDDRFNTVNEVTPVPQQVSRQKRSIRFQLQDDNEEDVEWLQNQEANNDQYLQAGTVVFPSWQIVSQKWARVEFKFGTGETWVVLEQYPNKRGYFTGIRLTEKQWNYLGMLLPSIQEYVRSSEKGGIWDNMAKFWGHELRESSSTSGNFGSQQVRMHVCDMIYVTVTSLDEQKQSGCQVDIREYVLDHRDNTSLVAIPHGLTLIGGGFDFLVRRLWPKIDAALQMYVEMYEAGGESFKHCFARIPDNEESVDSDLQCVVCC
jgi:hypothetical protein